MFVGGTVRINYLGAQVSSLEQISDIDLKRGLFNNTLIANLSSFAILSSSPSSLLPLLCSLSLPRRLFRALVVS